MPPKKKPDTKTSSKFLREVDVKIGDRVKTVKQDRIVEALTEVVLQKEKMLPHQNRLKELRTEVERLRVEIKTGTEKREVYCVKEYDFKHQAVRVRRTDTREVIEETTMTDEDRQEVMPGVPDPRDDGDKPKAPADAIREARGARGEGEDKEADDEAPPSN